MRWTCFFPGLLQLTQESKRRLFACCGFASFLTLGLMTGCQSSSPWIASHVQAGNTTYNSSRLSYRLHDIVNEIGVEMICAQGLINTYLEVHTQQIPPYQGNLKEALVVMNTSDQTKHAVGYRHEGGQRISLSADLQEFLITSLQNNQTVTISLKGYATTLNPHNFTTQFEQLHAKPLANPFQLPFKL